MSVYGINTAQKILRQLNEKSIPYEQSTNNSFKNVLSSQLLNMQLNESTDDTEGSTTNHVFSGLLDNTSDMSSCVITSLLGSDLSGGSRMMLLSLGNALSRLSDDQGMMGEMVTKWNYSPTITGNSNVTSTGEIPAEASKAVNPFITSDINNRDPDLYRQVINQFSVETNPRYAVNKKGHNDTYCNIFLWDVTRSMGAEISHYINPDTKEPMYYPDVKGAKELTANGICDWLHESGENYGWQEVGPQQAQEMANQGMPVVTALRNNDGGHGHVQVVCPSEDGKYDSERGVTIAQAGRNLTSYTPITKIYNKSLPKVSYFAHI